MSDFTNGFWSLYVAGITLAGILACLLLLWITARKKIPARTDNTTGHVWDGDLTEMNNPLPLWWVGLFILTIVFSLLYLVAYPGLGSYEGELKWTTRGEYESEVAQANKELEPLYAQFTARKPEELAGDAGAMAVGERLFMNNCAQCHGSDARSCS
jgi:cytochrome c oxidase cbb3-type subunit III